MTLSNPPIIKNIIPVIANKKLNGMSMTSPRTGIIIPTPKNGSANSTASNSKSIPSIINIAIFFFPPRPVT